MTNATFPPEASDDAWAVLADRLAALVSGGVPLGQAFSVVAGEAVDPAVREAFTLGAGSLEGDRAFLETFEAREERFSAYWRLLVRGYVISKPKHPLEALLGLRALGDLLRARVATQKAFEGIEALAAAPKQRVRRAAGVEFLRSLGTLIDLGVPLTWALEAFAAEHPETPLAEAARQAAALLSSQHTGESWLGVLVRAGEFSPSLLATLTEAWRAGRFDGGLLECAEEQERALREPGV